MLSRRSITRFTGYWLPPVLWMALIFWLSTDRFSGPNTGSVLERLLEMLGVSLEPSTLTLVHFLIRKLAHLTGFAVLALLLYRAFSRSRGWANKWAVSAFLVAAAYALLDEYHQALTLQRTGSLGDSLLDMVGSLGALVWRRISSSNLPARDEET